MKDLLVAKGNTDRILGVTAIEITPPVNETSR